MRPSESFVAQPIRSLQTMLRVIAQVEPSLPVLVPDGIYGQGTARAVAAFQELAGLPVTGITDQQTFEAIAARYAPALTRVGKAEPIEILLEPDEVLKAEDSGPYILLMQGMLVQIAKESGGFLPPASSGVLDAESSRALQNFQRLSGLPITGELDRITWKHLSRQFTLSAHKTNRVSRNLG